MSKVPDGLNPVYLIGLVSFGSKFCGIGRPGVYTRAESFLPWIEKQIGKNNDE
jgi:secreted trypsin-like serine protease